MQATITCLGCAKRSLASTMIHCTNLHTGVWVGCVDKLNTHKQQTRVFLSLQQPFVPYWHAHPTCNGSLRYSVWHAQIISYYRCALTTQKPQQAVHIKVTAACTTSYAAGMAGNLGRAVGQGWGPGGGGGCGGVWSECHLGFQAVASDFLLKACLLSVSLPHSL